MELVKSRVLFDQDQHTYTLDGKLLQGITGMIGRQLFPNKYSDVPKEVLESAAKRGAFIHETIELVDDLGISNEMQEVKGYIDLKELHCLRYEASEYLVSDNEYFASCIDKVYRESDTEFSLGDIKTTYKLDKDYIKWQLSIYAYLFETQNPGCKVVRLFGIWLRGDIHELVEVERIPDDIIKSLLNSEKNGEQFINPYSIQCISDQLPEKYKEIERSIVEVLDQSKYWSDKKKELSNGLMKLMSESNVYSWKGEKIQFIRKKDTIIKDFDKKSFEKDYPDLYRKYVKEVHVVGSVTLKTIE